MGALLAIYAKENGAGTIFEPEEAYLLEIQDEQEGESGIALATSDSRDNANADQDDRKDSSSKTSNKKSPSLRIVK
jgi:stringent starvation protein B